METSMLSANEKRLKNILLGVKLDIMPSSVDYFWLSDMATKIGGIYAIGWQRVLDLDNKIQDMIDAQHEEEYESLYWDEY